MFQESETFSVFSRLSRVWTSMLVSREILLFLILLGWMLSIWIVSSQKRFERAFCSLPLFWRDSGSSSFHIQDDVISGSDRSMNISMDSSDSDIRIRRMMNSSCLPENQKNEMFIFTHNSQLQRPRIWSQQVFCDQARHLFILRLSNPMSWIWSISSVRRGRILLSDMITRSRSSESKNFHLKWNSRWFLITSNQVLSSYSERSVVENISISTKQESTILRSTSRNVERLASHLMILGMTLFESTEAKNWNQSTSKPISIQDFLPIYSRHLRFSWLRQMGSVASRRSCSNDDWITS